jgi:hypothetical protein
MNRDRYDWELACPSCGAHGSARVSEDAFPESDIHFAVEKVSAGFRVSMLGSSAVDTVIVCIECNIEV